nr:MAG TPA_asm: hypothetical protein [Caudoviricetes sp.]
MVSVNVKNVKYWAISRQASMVIVEEAPTTKCL